MNDETLRADADHADIRELRQQLSDVRRHANELIDRAERAEGRAAGWEQSWRDCQRVCGDYQNRAERAEEHIAWMAQTVHQAYHPSGEWRDCAKDTCQSARRVLGGDGPHTVSTAPDVEGDWEVKPCRCAIGHDHEEGQ